MSARKEGDWLSQWGSLWLGRKPLATESVAKCVYMWFALLEVGSALIKVLAAHFPQRKQGTLIQASESFSQTLWSVTVTVSVVLPRQIVPRIVFFVRCRHCLSRACVPR